MYGGCYLFAFSLGFKSDTKKLCNFLLFAIVIEFFDQVTF